MWSFDKELKDTVFHFATIVERTIKSKLAYVVSKKYGISDYYSNTLNYSQNIYDTVKMSRFVTAVNNEVQDKLNKNDPMICHYKNSHGHIPCWVLVNILTFGNVSIWFQILKQEDKVAICKDLSLLLGHYIDIKDMENSLKVINNYRNLCAHDRRVYDYNAFTKISKNHPVNKNLKQGKDADKLFALICCFYTSLSLEDFTLLITKLSEIIDKLFKELSKSYYKTAIINKLGLPENLGDILLPQLQIDN